MKKLVKTLGASLLALSAIALFSCGSDGDEYNYNSNEVVEVKVDQPDVTVKTYYGTNYIYWTNSKNAQSYELYKNGSKVYSTADNYYKDTVKESGTYTYEVIAKGLDATTMSNVSAKQTIAYKWLDADPVVKTVTVEVPKATDLEKTVLSSLGASENYGTSSDITLSQGASGTYYVNFPAKTWLTYDVYLVDENEIVANSFSSFGTRVKSNWKASVLTSDDVANGLTTSVSITKAGTKYAVVKATDPIYSSTLYVVSKDSVSVPEIKLTSEDPDAITATATYLSKSDKTARVAWTPAKLQTTNDYAPTTDYVVYRQNDSTKAYEKLSAAVTESTEVTTDGVTIYYVDDTVPDTSFKYNYYIVLTDGTNYGSSSQTATLSAVEPSRTNTPEVSATTIVDSSDALDTTIKITSTKAKDKQTLTLSYVKLGNDDDVTLSSSSGDSALIYQTSAFTPLTLDNYNGSDESYINYINDASVGTYLIKLVASETDYEDSLPAYYVVNVSDPEVSTAYVSLIDGKVIVTEGIIGTKTKDDALTNYTYTLKEVTVTTNASFSDLVTVTTSDKKVIADSDFKDSTYGTYSTYETGATASTSTEKHYYYVVKSRVVDGTTYSSKSSAVQAPVSE